MHGAVTSWRFEALTEAMVMLDRIVLPAAAAGLLAFIVFHAAKRQWHALVALVILASGGALLSQSLKALVGRSRPPAVPLVEVSGYSFPSGQVLAVTLVAGWALHVASTSASKSARLLVAALATATVLLVGFSRIYLGAHYPGDVAASILIGMSWLGVCIAVRIPCH